MKEQLKAFILQKLGCKLPDDPNQDAVKVCGIKVFEGYRFDTEFQIIDKYDPSSLYVGVGYYSGRPSHVMLSICGNLTDGHGGRFCMRSVPLSNSKLDDGLESLVKLMRDGVIQLTGYPASEHPKFSDEDKVDHRTVALLATCNKKWLLSINLKHHMLTLPIGKVHPNESLLGGLCREMREELGFPDLVYMYGPSNIILKTKFKKTYDFDGTPVDVETFVFHVDERDRYANGIWGVAENREPEKCGGLMWVNRDDIRRIAESTGLLLADCVDAALNSDMTLVNHEVVPTGMPIISGIDKVKMREKAKRLKQ